MLTESVDDAGIRFRTPHIHCVDIDDMVNALYLFDHHFCIAEEVGTRACSAYSPTATARGEEIYGSSTQLPVSDGGLSHYDGVLYVSPRIVQCILDLCNRDPVLFRERLPRRIFPDLFEGSPRRDGDDVLDDYVQVVAGEDDLDASRVLRQASAGIAEFVTERVWRRIGIRVEICSFPLYKNSHRLDGSYEACDMLERCKCDPISHDLMDDAGRFSSVSCYRTYFSGRPLTVIRDAWVGPIRLRGYVFLYDLLNFCIADHLLEIAFPNVDWMSFLSDEVVPERLFKADGKGNLWSDPSTNGWSTYPPHLLSRLSLALRDTKSRTGMSFTSLVRQVRIDADASPVKYIIHPRAAMDLVESFTFAEGFKRMLIDELTRVLV